MADTGDEEPSSASSGGTDGEVGRLAARAAASAWVAAEPGLADAIVELDHRAGPAKRALPDRANRLAQPGPVPPARVARHVAAAGVSRAVRIGTRLPDLRDLVPLRDPRGWVLDTACRQLAAWQASNWAKMKK